MKFFQYNTWSVLFSVTLLAVACGGKGKQAGKGGPGSKGPVELDAAVASLSEFSNPIEMSGTILAAEQVLLRPEASGRIVFLSVPEGKVIKAGTLMLKLYDGDLQAQKKKLEAQLRLATNTESRLRQLLDVNGLNRQEYDVALSNKQTLEAELEQTEALIRKTEIRAPFDGVVGLRRVSEGAIVSPADVIASIQQLSKLKVDFQLPELWADNVRTGNQLKLRTATGSVYEARIEAIEPVLNTANRNLQVRAVLLSGTASLSPGSFVAVTLDVAAGRKSILIPTNSVIPETRFKKVALIRSGKAELVPVETGYRGQGLIEITKGLHPGDTFALNGILYLKPGADVKIRSVKSSDRK